MKKWMMLLCCVLALNLAACGAKEEGAADRVGAQGALHFEVATQVYENEYKADDGTVLMAERYELPMLELRTESGELYTPAENVTANDGAGRFGGEGALCRGWFERVYRGKLLDERADHGADLYDRGEAPEHRGRGLHLLRRRASQQLQPRVELRPDDGKIPDGR